MRVRLRMGLRALARAYRRLEEDIKHLKMPHSSGIFKYVCKVSDEACNSTQAKECDPERQERRGAHVNRRHGDPDHAWPRIASARTPFASRSSQCWSLRTRECSRTALG